MADQTIAIAVTLLWGYLSTFAPRGPSRIHGPLPTLPHHDPHALACWNQLQFQIAIVLFVHQIIPLAKMRRGFMREEVNLYGKLAQPVKQWKEFEISQARGVWIGNLWAVRVTSENISEERDAWISGSRGVVGPDVEREGLDLTGVTRCGMRIILKDKK